jgi:hypothetical protein
MTAPPLKVVTLYETNFRSPAQTLRSIADDIADGKYGDVSCVALSLLGDRLHVFAAGPDSDATSAVCVLMAGANKLLRPIEEHGE